MRIYVPAPNEYIRLQITRLGEETQYLTLIDTNRKEVEAMCKQIVHDAKLDPFAGGKKTSINIREAVGGKNGKQKSLSFHGLSPEEMMKRIVAFVNKQSKVKQS